MTKKIRRPITLSLFSGAGGLDIGFHNAGFDIVACVELEKAFCNTLRANVGKFYNEDCQVIEGDIRELDPNDIKAQNIDFIIGGPPCQSFSAMGRRAGGAEGVKDKRGGLFEHYVRLVQHYKPVGFLFENVRGIISTNKGKDWEYIIQTFQDIGYSVTYRVLHTADYGVPQRRERMIMVGYREGGFKFPRPIYGPDASDKKPYITALDAIRDLQDPNEQSHHFTGKYGKLLEEVPPGQNYLYFTKEMGHPQPVFAWRSRFSDFLYKADPNAPVRTIVAKLGAYSGPFHWKNRRFTVAEFKRLQTFPDDYVITGNEVTTLQQIGNSVPPAFANVLAKAVLQNFFGYDMGLDLLGGDEKLTFDHRKKQKAKATLSKKQTPLPLFDLVGNDQEAPSQRENHEVIYQYLSNKDRKNIGEIPDTYLGRVYKVQSDGENGEWRICVSRHDKETGFFENNPLAQYTLTFNHPIGNGLYLIECELNSKNEEDIPVAWDAIEDLVSKVSSYKTMFDIYGHFTEPHPLFKLKMEVLSPKPGFILSFAKEFSAFPQTKKVLPAEFLAKLFNEAYPGTEFDFTQSIKRLRDLRFDVRVHETNRIIPPGFFRCAYPFTLSNNRQVSITWRETQDEETMAKDERFSRQLQRAYDEAVKLLEGNAQDNIARYKRHPSLSRPLLTMDGNGKTVLLGQTVAEGIETIIGNSQSNKYLYSILITALVVKLVNPEQDIRYSQSEMPGGYSNRNTDQTHVTPFLKRVGLTHCEASGMESGRNFERPLPLKLDFPGKPRGKGNREAVLGILHAVEEEGVDPFPCLVYLMALDKAQQTNQSYEYPLPTGRTIQEIVDAFVRHFELARGNGRARLPVLAIQAVYMCITPELARYKDKELLPINRLTANDKLGWIGDIQVNNQDGTPFEGVEVKAGKSITGDMIRALPRKLQGNSVDRYYILSTEMEYISKENHEDAHRAVIEVRGMTGCEVIPNGLIRSLWYYLRLISDKDKFLKYYTELVETDQDVHKEHRALWSDILNELNKSSDEEG